VQQHADRVVTFTRNVFDGPPLSTEERRKHRFSQSSTTFVGSYGSRGSLNNAQLELTRMVMREATVANESEESTTLTSREQIKYARVMEAIESLFVMVTPVEHSVQRAVRIATDRLYKAATLHRKVCTLRRASNANSCELHFLDRSATLIATAAFDHTVKWLHSQSLETQSTDVQALSDLIERMANEQCLRQRLLAPQLQAVRAIMTVMSKPCFCAHTTCSTSEDGSQRTIVSCEPTPIEMLVETTRMIFASHTTALPKQCLDKALATIRTHAFTERLKTTTSINSLNTRAVALCVLHYVLRVWYRRRMSQCTPPTIPTAEVRRACVCAEDLEAGIVSLQGVVPDESICDQSVSTEVAPIPLSL
jgi:hypothetical protein